MNYLIEKLYRNYEGRKFFMERVCAKCGRPILDEQQTCLGSPTNNENVKNQRKNKKESEKSLCLDCEIEMKIKAYEMQLEM
jgi:hypothetical protein